MEIIFSPNDQTAKIVLGTDQGTVEITGSEAFVLTIFNDLLAAHSSLAYAFRQQYDADFKRAFDQAVATGRAELVAPLTQE